MKFYLSMLLNNFDIIKIWSLLSQKVAWNIGALFNYILLKYLVIKSLIILSLKI